MKKELLRYSLPSLFILFIAVSIFSCSKSGPADAVVTVVDTLGKPVAAAKVVLRQDSVVNPNTGVKASVHQEGSTDSQGQVRFSFSLEAVLNIEASKGALFGRDYIRLEQSNTVEKTVKIK
jgi:hypothetical protein